jgi:cell division protein FtsL
MSTDGHIPIIPTNLGEHGNFITKCRDSTGKIDPDAKLAIGGSNNLDIPKMKHKPTKEETEANNSKSGFFSEISLMVVIMVFLVILLILAIVWLGLKYNNLRKESEVKETNIKAQLEEKIKENNELEGIIHTARQQWLQQQMKKTELTKQPENDVKSHNSCLGCSLSNTISVEEIKNDKPMEDTPPTKTSSEPDINM